MPFVTVGKENSALIDLHYEDHGHGQPVVLIHGYPLNGNSWEKQERALLDAGYRVITYDRRGFGKSSQPTIGYDYDTFAADLHTLIEHLQLRDIVLCGFSMGSGEVVRYLSIYGPAGVSRAVLIGALPPFLMKTADNPEGGVDQATLDGFAAAAAADRPAFFKSFLDNLYGMDTFRGTRVSEHAWLDSFHTALTMSPYAAVACVSTWATDFRNDLPDIDVPTLVVHGDADGVLPVDATAKRLPGLIGDLQLVTISGGPHNIAWTHADEVNRALLAFLR